MVDKEGKILINEGLIGEDSKAYTFTLHDDEVIVGFRSRTDRKIAQHYDFHLIVMRDNKEAIEAELL